MRLPDRCSGLASGIVHQPMRRRLQTGDDFTDVRIDDETPPVSIPVRFVVNRCDPYALAEVTKRNGLDLDISIDHELA